jgi:mono/diheme cytochrome c family protein
MSASRARTSPLAVGLVAAAAAFAGVAAATSTDTAGSESPARARPVPPAAKTIDSGHAVFLRMGCGSCHRLAAVGSQGEIGPDLDERLPAHTAASLRAKIVDPSGGLGAGFSYMPEDFGARMTDKELAALVRFLMSARHSAPR